MSISFRQFGDTICQLANALERLESQSTMLQIAPLAGREWFELLRQKLVPQLKDDAFLVVAVVGGTNIGKSVVFNHLAGCRASATSPLASGTKHPVCLVPTGFTERHDLPSIFSGFDLRPWSEASQALEDHAEHLLFWRDSPGTPHNLLVLDTPDIDSDAPVNWQRADHVRRSADILIAILTQQKYNDAAVKQFFRRAAQEDKAVVIVFNQCLLPDDEAYWPLWLGTFCRETGIVPEIVYVTPNDRRAAEENRLPFYERRWPIEGETAAPKAGGGHAEARTPAEGSSVRSPAEDLSRFRFAEVKLRTLRGSLQHLSSSDLGAPAYLREVQARSAEFRTVAERLSSESVIRVADWPVLPSSLFVDQLREWWAQHQSDFARKVTGVYSTVTKGIVWPFKKARDYLQGEPVPPIDQYRDREWSAMLSAVQQVFEKLEFMSESGNELLRPHFARLLAGAPRQALIDRLKTAHASVDFAAEVRSVVDIEMERFRTEAPDKFRLLRNFKDLTAYARPVTSLVLFSIGFGPAGEAVAPVMAHAVTTMMGHVAFDIAGGTAVAAAGEVGVDVAGRGVGFVQAKMQRLEASFTQRRLTWMLDLLKTHLLGTLPEELAAAAAIPQSEAFRAAQSLMAQLNRQLAAAPTVLP